MSGINIIRECEIVRTPRVLQLEGLFDVSPLQRSREIWTVNLEVPEEWNLGVIVGPSGSGKTTVLEEVFGKPDSYSWSADQSVVDDFPRDLGIKDITGLLSSVGFSSPPSWLRPYRVLSSGEQFRVNIARALAENKDVTVVDEYTSVVDRTVAKIASVAIAKNVRRNQRKLVLATCHYDVLDWLEPDWVYEPHNDKFYNGRYLHQRPKIELEIVRVHSSYWSIFRKHHYLDASIHPGSVCFMALWEGNPVAFGAVLHFPHPKVKNIKRGHRTVCLPDYQGAGIGNAVSKYIASICKALGYRYQSITSHPAMIYSRYRSEDWRMISRPNTNTKAMPKTVSLGGAKGRSSAPTRMRATFEYVGPALDLETAERLYYGR